MSPALRPLLSFIGRKFLFVGYKLNPPPKRELTAREKEAERWFAVDGDHTLRLNYDLSETSLVMDLGGYEGQWASDIEAKYLCRIEIFEPVARFADAIKARFAANPRIRVHQIGLADKDTETEIWLEDDQSSLFKRESAPTEKIKLIRAASFFEQEAIERINLMKINIEGGEYDLLDHLIETGWVKMIDDIQVQFHEFVPEAAKRMKAIQRALAETHEPTYQYEFLWESWRLKGRK